MQLHILDSRIWFPPITDTLEDGLLAIGGDLSTERLLMAYRLGIFPWYDGDVPLWWCPDPRFVLYPHKLRISKSMKQLLKQQKFHFTINTAFEQVIKQCMLVKRPDQDGTWINEDVIKAYTTLHYQGFAHSAEVWYNNELVGGLYGVRLNNLFFGESMFSLASNASKYAFICYVQQLIQEAVVLIDCQVYTQHLESFGAEMISRSEFLEVLKENIKNKSADA
jgi:leucyl/phenylalanyl-tRNA--protein transferase